MQYRMPVANVHPLQPQSGTRDSSQCCGLSADDEADKQGEADRQVGAHISVHIWVDKPDEAHTSVHTSARILADKPAPGSKLKYLAKCHKYFSNS